MYYVEVTFKLILDEERLPDPLNPNYYVLLLNTETGEYGFVLDTELKDNGSKNEASFHPVVKVKKIR